MADELSIPGADALATNEPVQAAAAAATSLEQTSIFMEAYDCAKNNYQWNKVLSAISSHPEWLTRIPQGRRWTMLHQIVYCGNVPHLNEILAFEISNEQFRLLCKSLDDKTVREVASDRAHIYPQMLYRIERLVAIDQLLNNARDGKWELVKQFLRQQGNTINEKPPYRKYYLAHFLAATGQLDIFKELNEICPFRLDLRADNKTINEVARENDFIEFAEHIEALSPNMDQIAETIHPTTPPTNDADSSSATTNPFFSQGFNNDQSIMILSLNSNSFGTMLLSSDDSILQMSNPHAWSELQLQTAPAATTTAQNATSGDAEQANSKKVNVPPPMTDEEQMQYEKIVMDNINKFSADNLLSSAVTCCITKAILRDPVVAADGFTYEREAIVNWFKHSNRSPMTNQEVENQELKPNHAIKSILRSLAELTVKEDPSSSTAESNGDGTV